MLRVIVALSKTYGDVFQLWLGPLDTVITSVPSDVAQILSATHLFERPTAMQCMFEAVVPGSLVCTPRHLHAVARRHLRNNFNFTLLEGFHLHMTDAAVELCQVLSDIEERTPPGILSAPFNISEQLSIAVFRVILNVAFGCNLDREQRLHFAKCTDRLVDEMMLDFVGHPLRQWLSNFGSRSRLFNASQQVNEFCQTFILERLGETEEQSRRRPQDLLDAIIDLERADVDKVTSQVVVFAVAGAHTTSETLAWSIYETCCNPSVAHCIHDELQRLLPQKSIHEHLSHDEVSKLKYLRNVWKETLRKHPPGPMFARRAVKDVHLSGSGTFVPKGKTVVALSQGSHMDRKVWNKPQLFSPERWGEANREGEHNSSGAYVPFSVGSRACPGRFLADHEGVLILAEMHRRFEFRLACDADSVASCSGWAEFSRAAAKGQRYEAGLPISLVRR